MIEEVGAFLMVFLLVTYWAATHLPSEVKMTPRIDDEALNELAPSDFGIGAEATVRELILDLRDARKELAELRAGRAMVFIAVRQLESLMAEHLRIVESLKK